MSAGRQVREARLFGLSGEGRNLTGEAIISRYKTLKLSNNPSSNISGFFWLIFGEANFSLPYRSAAQGVQRTPGVLFVITRF